MTLRNKVMTGLYWSTTMRILAQGFTWAVTVVVIRLLSPADYGLMAMAGVFISFLGMLNEMGLGTVVVQKKDLKREELVAIFGLIMVVSLVFCVTMISASPLIASYYVEPQLVKILLALSFIFLFSGLSVIPRSLLLRNLEYKKIATVEFISAIAGSICTLIMALLGMGVWSLVGGYLSIRIVSMVGFYSFEPFWCFPRFNIKGMKEIFTFSGQITASRILWYLYASAAASLIVGKIMGKEALGIYGVALMLASLPMEKVSGIINQVAFPAFSSIQDDVELAGRHFLKAVRILCVVAFPVFWGISSVSENIIDIFLGGKWHEAAVPLQIIAFVVPLRMIRNLMNPALIGLGRADVDLKNEIVGVVLVPIGFFVGSFYGLVGVSLVWALVFPVVFVINMESARKVLKLTIGSVYREFWRPAIASSVMYVSVFMIKKSILFSFPKMEILLVSILTGAISYMIISFVVNKLVLFEAFYLFKNK